MTARHAGGADDLRHRTVARVQTGVWMEKRLLLVLKAFAGALDLTFGGLLEGIVLRAVYHLDLRAADSHLLIEAPRRKRPAR